MDYRLTDESMIVSGHIIKRGQEPRSIRDGSGKWDWLRLAVKNSPQGEWMSFEFPNRQEAYRCQSTLNSKSVKGPLRKRGLDIRTRVHSTIADQVNGPFTTFWMVYEK